MVIHVDLNVLPRDEYVLKRGMQTSPKQTLIAPRLSGILETNGRYEHPTLLHIALSRIAV